MARTRVSVVDAESKLTALKAAQKERLINNEKQQVLQDANLGLNMGCMLILEPMLVRSTILELRQPCILFGLVSRM